MKYPVQSLIGIVVVGSFLGLLMLWTFVSPPGNPDQVSGMLNTLIGVLAGLATAVSSFYFGSSSGSRDKDTTIADMAKNGDRVEPKEDLGDPLK